MRKEIDLLDLFKEFCNEWSREFDCEDNCEIFCPAYCFVMGVYFYVLKGRPMKESVRNYMYKSIPLEKKKEIVQESLARTLRVSLKDIQERWEQLKEKLKET